MKARSPIQKPVTPPELMPEKPYMLSIQGDLFRMQLVLPRMDHYTGGKKEMIFHFSRQSRLNLLKVIATIDWPTMGTPLFITLTYPDSCLPIDCEQMNRQRWVFLRYIEKYLGKTIPCLWRIEWKPRKSGDKRNYLYPHKHLLAFTDSYVPYEYVRESWQKALCTDVYVRTDVQRAISGKNGGFYVAKYASKDNSSLVHAAYLNNAHNGRSWGIMRSELLVYCQRRELRMGGDKLDTEQLGIVMDRLGNARPFQNQAFTLFGREAVQCAKFLMADLLEQTGES